MGIKSNFRKFIQEKCPEAFETIHISDFAYKRIAVDISLYMHKFKAVAGDNWLSCFLNLIGALRDNEVHTVFIYDGKSPIEKIGEQQKRRQTQAKIEKNIEELEIKLQEYYDTQIIPKIFQDMYKQSKGRFLGKKNNFNINYIEEQIQKKKNQLISVSIDDFNLTKNLFKILNVPYFEAPGEAEKMCSKLFLDGKVDAVLSEDSDVIAYGANLLSKLNTYQGTVVHIDYEKILEKLSLSRNEFLDFCIMCGTDYNSNIPKIGSATSYKKILKYKSIEKLKENTNLDITILNHEIVRKLFTKFEDYNIDKIPYCGKPNFQTLKQFSRINNLVLNIPKLEKQFVHVEIVFEDE